MLNMNYGIIENNILQTIVVANTPTIFPFPVVEIFDNEDAQIGQVFNPEGNPRFTGTPYKPPQSWTAYQFLLRFTTEERAAFRAAALTDPNVADFQQLAQAAQEVISNDPMTVAGMNYLVSVNLLTEQRKNEILGLT
jgi:hypothetical protein